MLGKVSRHPTTGIGLPMDKQAGLFIAPECKRVLNVVDWGGLQLSVSRRLAPSRRVKRS